MKQHERYRRAVAAAALGATGAVGVPSVAQAHDWQAQDVNDAQLNVDDDGYGVNGGIINVFGTGTGGQVTGRSFAPNDLAHIYLCKAGEVDFPANCQIFGVLPTNANGRFSGTARGVGKQR